MKEKAYIGLSFVFLFSFVIFVDGAVNIKWMGGYTFGKNTAIDLELERDRLYVGSGGGVLIVDVEDPLYMFTVSERIQTPGVVSRVKKISNYLYVSCGELGFEIWNILWSPTRASSTTPGFPVQDIAPYLSYILVVSDSGYLCTYYVGAVSDPILSGETRVGGYAFRVEVKDAVAYVATRNNGVRVFSILSPSSPEEIGGILDGQQVFSMFLYGNYLCVGDDRFLYVYDVSTPSLPLFVSSVELGQRVVSIAYVSGFIYAGTSSGDSSFGISIIDFSNPREPVQSSFIPMERKPIDMRTNIGYLFIATEKSVEIFSITHPGEPSFMSNLFTPDFYCRGWAYNGDLFISYEQGGMKVLNAQNPSNLYTVGVTETGSNGIEAVFNGDYLYLLTENSLLTYDISSVWAITLIDSLYIASEVYSLAGNGSYLFVAAGENGVYLLRAEDPRHPYVFDSISVPQAAFSVELLSNRLVVACGESGVIFYDISNIHNPLPISNFVPGGFSFDVKLVSRFAFVGVRELGVIVVDLSRFEEPRAIDTLVCDSYPFVFSVVYPLVYVGDITGRFICVDVSNPSSVSIVGEYLFPRPVLHIDADSAFCYVSASGIGVHILRFTGTIAPTRFEISLRPGWNLVSIPREGFSFVGEIFPFVSTPVYIYDTQLRRYVPVDTLNPGRAYWVLAFVDTSVVVEGRGLERYVVELFPGWNMVGALSFNSPSTLFTSYDFVIPPLYFYRDGRYYQADSLLVGNGYWVLSRERVSVEIPAGSK